jgi:hypothetical protein
LKSHQQHQKKLRHRFAGAEVTENYMKINKEISLKNPEAISGYVMMTTTEN